MILDTNFISMLLCCSKMAVVSYYFFFFLHLLVAVIFIFAENAAEDIHYSLQFCWTYFTLHANFMLCMNMASDVDKSTDCFCICGVIFYCQITVSTVYTFGPPRSWCLQWGSISFTELYFDRGNFYDFTSLGEFLVHDMPVRIIVDLCNVWTCDLFFSSMLEILKYRLVS